jgi:type I restriction enzyme S subunit
VSTLPTSWVETNLGTVVPYGATVKAEPKDLTPDTWVLELEDIEKDTTKVLQRMTFSERQSKSTKNRFDVGDILYGKLRPYLNKVTFADQPGVCTTEIVPIKPTEVVDGRYLFHWLRHHRFLNYVTDVSHGVNMPRLGTEAGRQAPFVLAPKNEQKRIADKLDAVLIRVDAVNTRLAHIAPILKRFRQSVLAAAASGRLTEDWRHAHRAAYWTPQTVESLCLYMSDGPFGSNLKSDDYTGGGARVVRLENIGHLSFDAVKETFISMDKYETLKKHTLMPGDLLFSSFVDEEVRVCEFPANIAEPAINKADCFCLRVDRAQVDPRFLAFRLACKSTYQSLKDLVHGATRPRINLRQLRGFEVMLPSTDEQAEILRRVETLFTHASRLEARLQTARTTTERLTPALLAKAFRGDLVPQDPNDEPASELLRRLQQEAPLTSAKRGRKSAG